MLVARFFYQRKYSKWRPNMLEYRYFNALNMIKITEYIIVNQNKSIDGRYKKWKYICKFS